MTGGIVAVICIVAIALIVVSFFLGKNIEKKSYSDTIGTAQSKARQIIDEAQKNAENAKMEALITAKEQILKSKNDLENRLDDLEEIKWKMEKSNLILIVIIIEMIVNITILVVIMIAVICSIIFK